MHVRFIQYANLHCVCQCFVSTRPSISDLPYFHVLSIQSTEPSVCPLGAKMCSSTPPSSMYCPFVVQNPVYARALPTDSLGCVAYLSSKDCLTIHNEEPWVFARVLPTRSLGCVVYPSSMDCPFTIHNPVCHGFAN